MNIRFLYFFLLICFNINFLFSQDNVYSSLTIPDELKKNANAVIRLNELDIEIKSPSEMVVRKKRIVTVLNKQGNNALNTYVHYDKNVKIKELEALVFNDWGSEIKKVKKNDFKDVSAVEGGTLYSDSRVKYLEYTPINYPYTVMFTCETISSNTAFITSFFPIDEYFVSVQKAAYSLKYPDQITIRKKEKNLEDISVVKNEIEGGISYEVEDLKVIKPEDYSPSFSDIAPKVLFASNMFSLEGVSAKVNDWNDFARWMYHDLIKVTHDLPEETIIEVRDLVKEAQSDIDKAKIIYKYVQDKVRYIGVQVGIGGWKPFNASYVDRLSYGDCKALTNYTMVLLNAVGVKSNYCLVWRYTQGKSIEKDFTSMQGNHAFLNIPVENGEDIWLECTSQSAPFGLIANSTDDRDVLVITPEGGKIKHTKKYVTEENTQVINGKYEISSQGDIKTSFKISSKGIQYDDKFGIEDENERDLKLYYKNRRWKYINNITFNEIKIENDKERIEFIEQIQFDASNYAKLVGERMLVNINALNRNNQIPDLHRDRKLPLKINRGYKDIDQVEVKLPNGYKVEALPEKIIIENKFGKYLAEVIFKNEDTLIYKREFIIEDGEFPKEDYDDFRDFYKEVSRYDNAKVALVKK